MTPKAKATRQRTSGATSPKNLLHRKRNHKQSEKTNCGMGKIYSILSKISDKGLIYKIYEEFIP